MLLIDDYGAGNMFVTGELGSGKTMFAVQMIQAYLDAGRRVATNLDIYTDKLMPEKNRTPLFRLPDKPTREHFDQLNDAYPVTVDSRPLNNDFLFDVDKKIGYNEKSFGLIVLDECLTWLNSRGWQDKERAKVLDWFLHARKHGWNVLFLMQSADYCDPQLRETLLTYHVSCRKMGKYKIPIIGKVTGLRMPSGTMATITAGYGTNSIPFAREFYRGKVYYSAYDTAQVFKSGFEFIGRDSVDMRALSTILPANFFAKPSIIMNASIFKLRLPKIRELFPLFAYWFAFQPYLIALKLMTRQNLYDHLIFKPMPKPRVIRL